MNKKVNINGIAQRLKISPATVSLALSDDSRVKQETKDKVKKLSRKLNYFPNVFARGLVQQKSLTLIVILPVMKNVMEDPHILSGLKGIYSVLENTDYKVLLEINNSRFRAKRDYLRPFIDGSTCGMLMLGSTLEDEFLQEIATYNIVQIGSYHPEIETSFVTGDNIKAGKIAAEYLLSKYPEKKFGMIYGPGTIVSLNDRKKGFLTALKKQGKDIEFNCMVEAKRVSVAAGKDAAREIINQGVEVIFCCNDILARGACSLLKEIKIKPGKKIKVMGIDGINRAREGHITTVNYPVEEMAKIATRAIIYNHLPIQKVLDVDISIGNTA